MSLQLPQQLTPPHVVSSLTDATNKLPIAPPCKIYFKNDLEQPSGSFKLRGIGNLIYQSYLKYQNSPKQCQVFASSGGNAGLAAAYSAWYYKIPCTVVLPVVSKPQVRQQLIDYNAKIILFGNTIYEADKYLKTLIALIDQTKIQPIYCHPFDNPLIWQGHASLVDELTNQLPDPSKLKGVVCSCGGGGLYNGIYQGLQNNNIDAKILLVETKQAPTLSESLKANKLVTLDSVNSLATSLACSYTTQQSLNNYHNNDKVSTSLELIDDLDAVKGCVDYFDAFGKVIEPACGASLSVIYSKLELLYKHFQHLSPDDAVVIVVCGGSCTTEKDLQDFRKLIARNETKL